MLHGDLPGPAGAGGVRHQVAGLSQTLAARGHDVVVHTFSERPRGATYEVARLPLARRIVGSGPGELLAAPPLFATRSFAGYDVIHAHGGNHLLHRRTIPMLRTFYGSARDERAHATSRKRRMVEGYNAACESVGRRLADDVVAISQSTADRVGGADAIVPCAVDLQRFAPGPKSSTPTVLFVGTMGGRKRGGLVVESFLDAVVPVVDGARLVLVAGDAPERSHPSVEVRAAASNAELAGLMREAWVFTMPSTYEGFGVPYIEAMASGTPVVTTANDGAREIFAAGGRGGILVGDRQLGSTLAAVLADESLRQRLAGDGVAASRSYSWESVADRYEERYRRLQAGRASG